MNYQCPDEPAKNVLTGLKKLGGMTDRRMRFSNLKSGFKLAHDENSKVDMAYSNKDLNYIPHARKRANLDLLPSFKGCDGVFDTSDKKVERRMGLKCNI